MKLCKNISITSAGYIENRDVKFKKFHMSKTANCYLLKFPNAMNLLVFVTEQKLNQFESIIIVNINTHEEIISIKADTILYITLRDIEYTDNQVTTSVRLRYIPPSMPSDITYYKFGDVVIKNFEVFVNEKKYPYFRDTDIVKFLLKINERS